MRDVAALALILWVVIFLGLGSMWIVANHRFLEAYRRRYGGFMSDGERMDAFGASPRRLVRRLPGDTLARMSALDSRPEDPTIEHLRRRAVRFMDAVRRSHVPGTPGVAACRRIDRSDICGDLTGGDRLW